MDAEMQAREEARAAEEEVVRRLKALGDEQAEKLTALLPKGLHAEFVLEDIAP